MSLQKITFYWWNQDRYGSFVALLAAWIRNPLDNVYAQLGLQLMAGLVSPIFFCYFLVRRPIDSWYATILADASLLIVAPIGLLQHIFTQGNPYAVSLASAGLASLALRKRSAGVMVLVGTVGVVIAYVVNIALMLVALPLVALFAILLPSASSARLLVAHLLAATAGLLLPNIFAPEFHTSLAMAFSLHDIAVFARNIWANSGWPFVLAVLIPAMAVLCCLIIQWKLRILWLYSVFIATMLVVAALYLVLMASSRHVAVNLFIVRYFVPGYLLLISVAGVSLWLVVAVSQRGRGVRNLAFVVLSALLLLVGYVRLRAEAVQNIDILGDEHGVVAREVAARYVSLSLDGIAGDYWYVWPAVLMAEQYRYDAGLEGAHVFGLAFRGYARRDEFIARLEAAGRLRLACIDLQPDECVTQVSSVMRLPGLGFSVLSATESLFGKHSLSFAEISPAAIPK